MKEECEKAKLTYLPPIDASITDFGTIYKLFEMLLLRAGKVNVPYVNLTLDYGTIIQTEITCKKVPCYMRESACRWFIVRKSKIF